MSHDFALLLFSTNPEFIQTAIAAGVDAIVVDWEHIGKAERQADADTQINHDTIDDLRNVRACVDAPIICRVNRYGETTATEVAQAIEGGATEILLPMVRRLDEVEATLDLAQGRCGVGILIETAAAIASLPLFASLPLSRVYVGLNDLAIERQTPSIFTAVVDGTVEHIRHHVDVPFGFGGLTVPDRGYPVPCRLLVGEMARLKCDFSFLRRSFHRDISGRDLSVEVPRMRQALRQARHRSPQAIARDRHDLAAVVHSATWPLIDTGEVNGDG